MTVLCNIKVFIRRLLPWHSICSSTHIQYVKKKFYANVIRQSKLLFSDTTKFHSKKDYTLFFFINRKSQTTILVPSLQRNSYVDGRSVQQIYFICYKKFHANIASYFIYIYVEFFNASNDFFGDQTIFLFNSEIISKSSYQIWLHSFFFVIIFANVRWRLIDLPVVAWELEKKRRDIFKCWFVLRTVVLVLSLVKRLISFYRGYISLFTISACFWLSKHVFVLNCEICKHALIVQLYTCAVIGRVVGPFSSQVWNCVFLFDSYDPSRCLSPTIFFCFCILHSFLGTSCTVLHEIMWPVTIQFVKYEYSYSYSYFHEYIVPGTVET